MKKDVYVCVTESLCCTTEINTVHQLYFIKIKLKKKKKKNCERLCLVLQGFHAHIHAPGSYLTPGKGTRAASGGRTGSGQAPGVPLFFCFSFYFPSFFLPSFLFKATSAAYGSSWDRGQIRAASVSRTTACSNAGYLIH